METIYNTDTLMDRHKIQGGQTNLQLEANQTLYTILSPRE